MNRSRCPHCRHKLGDFLYADSCPRCNKVLAHNQVRASAPGSSAPKRKSWPIRALGGVVKFVES